jgi:hypothetical protein
MFKLQTPTRFSFCSEGAREKRFNEKRKKKVQHSRILVYGGLVFLEKDGKSLFSLPVVPFFSLSSLPFPFPLSSLLLFGFKLPCSDPVFT